MTSPTAPVVTLEGLLCDFADLDDQQITDELLSRVRARRRAEAEDAALMRVLHSRIVAANNGFVNGATAEIGVMLAVSDRSADHLVDAGYELTSRPVVWEALYWGVIDAVKARKIVTLLSDVVDPLRESLEREAVGYGASHTAAQLHRRLVRMTCDEDPEEKARAEALDRRGLTVIEAGHGMAHIAGYVSSEHAQAFMAGIDHLVKTVNHDPYGQGDARSLDQRRADALAGFIEDHSFWDVNVSVIMPADMLMGVETAGATLNGSPCTRGLAVKLAWSPDARWTRMVTDPLTGVLMDVGRTKYEIPATLRNAVRLRDVTCRFRGCTRRAEFTDTDHVERFADSGTTDPSGLVCLCRHHHRIKTFEHWQVTTSTTYAHELTWTGPFGTRVTTHPWTYHPPRPRE
jgi:hypothetical protein